MIFLGFIIAVSIAMQSYISFSKLYIENKKITFFLINIITIVLSIKLFLRSWNDYYVIKPNDIYCSIVIIILDICSILEYIYRTKKMPNKKFIKQSIDNSADGIMTINNKGKIIFQNKTMYNLISSLEIYDNYVENIKTKAVKKIENDYIVLINDIAWMFVINEEGNEITAFNINEEYKLNEELKEKNNILEQNNEKVIWTIEHIEELEKEEKTLKIKNKFHDVLGNNLSILQAYLNQDDLDNKTFDEIKFMIKKMFIDLEDSESPEDNLNNLLKINRNLGIKINLDGVLPKDNDIAKVFFEIIREGITNAIRHSNSEEIDIKIEDNILGKTLTICNDVENPKDSIIENEGIKGMRRKVKKIGGSIFVNPVPRFTIKVEI